MMIPTASLRPPPTTRSWSSATSEGVGWVTAAWAAAGRAGAGKRGFPGFQGENARGRWMVANRDSLPLADSPGIRPVCLENRHGRDSRPAQNGGNKHDQRGRYRMDADRHGAGPVHDPTGAGPVLWRPGSGEEHPLRAGAVHGCGRALFGAVVRARLFAGL